MYFNNLRFGEALAIAGKIKDGPSGIKGDYLSDTAKEQLHLLNTRIAAINWEENQDELLEFKNNRRESREIIENYFIYAFCGPPEQNICAALYKAAVLTLPIFEEFCTILKDYIEMQKKLNFNNSEVLIGTK